MRLKVRCPTCGKSVRYEDGDAGQQALCRACGARVDLPPAPLLAPFDSGARDAGGIATVGAGDGPAAWSSPSRLQDPAGSAAARPGHNDPTVDEWPYPEWARRLPRWLLPSFAGAAACVAIVGVALVAWGRLGPAKGPARTVVAAERT